jgi:hypothetical protein
VSTKTRCTRMKNAGGVSLGEEESKLLLLDVCVRTNGLKLGEKVARYLWAGRV